MATVRPMKIPGRWREGYALDYHTLSSAFIGHDEFGHPQFDTKRSEVGELLYRLKNKSDQATITELVDAAAGFVAHWNPGIDAVVPVPPSRVRAVQPVIAVAAGLAQRFGVELADWVRRAKEVPELKNVYDYDQRVRLLESAHAVDRAKAQGRRVLLFDDLYRSGATMNAITVTLYDQGGVADVFALTLTRTRRNL